MSTDADEDNLGIGLTGWIIFMIFKNGFAFVWLLIGYFEDSSRGGLPELYYPQLCEVMLSILNLVSLMALWLLRKEWCYYLLIAMIVTVFFLSMVMSWTLTNGFFFDLTAIIILGLLIPKWGLFN